jgi:hypothetical protein
MENRMQTLYNIFRLSTTKDFFTASTDRTSRNLPGSQTSLPNEPLAVEV